MSGAVDRENEIFDTIREFNEVGLEFIVVGGYAVSAFQHRFSVDAALVVREIDLDEFVEILKDRSFEQVEDRDLVYGGRFLAYEKDRELPVTIDLLVDSLQCRQTDASWSYQYFNQNATSIEVRGSEKSVEVRIPERELLIAVKLHSGRLTDARDAVALASNVDIEQLEKHLDRGDQKRLQQVLEEVLGTINSEDFEDAFKGVFQQQELPANNIEKIRGFIQDKTDR